ncbi:aspartic protease PEP1 [Patellaria atrata CBS 101060]|uniref:Aspartic protease PEP1 n=1 Tax=Patellaria atrata CBS 101060 TaxID=1346257 RepID=A0A9P4SJA8_9PEZI|nr:aspartic protease PEP1 [Patellaria atrata CBS 101060]
MPSLRSLVTFTAALGAVIATPVKIEELQKRKTFSIAQTAERGYYKNGPREVAKTFAKYGKEPPSAARVAAEASVTGSVAAIPGQFDIYYLSPVEIGGKILELDFDTGSADLWVFSSLLPTAQQSGHAIYDPSQSTTAVKKEGQTWRIQYGDGSGARGTVYADKVVVGGITATSQAVEAATSVSAQFQQDVDNDGLLGLSFSVLNTVRPNRETTFFDTVREELAAPLFAVTLKKGAPGTYDFGYIDESKYVGSIAYADVITTNGFWEFTPTAYSIGNGSAVQANIDAIADTGTSLAYLPTAIIRDYYSKVPGAQYNGDYGGYTHPCAAEMPSFSLTIAGQKRTTPGSYINYAPIDEAETTCFGGLQSDEGIGFSILGDIFLKSQYVVHDVGTTPPRIGFAQQPGTV